MYKQAYKIQEDGTTSTGSFKKIPDDWIEYQKDFMPQELLDGLNKDSLQYDTVQSKEQKLNNLTVTTTSGKIFYADPESRTDILDVVMEGLINQLPDEYTTEWKTVSRGEAPFEVVTFAELKEAKRLALEAKGQIVGVE